MYFLQGFLLITIIILGEVGVVSTNNLVDACAAIVLEEVEVLALDLEKHCLELGSVIYKIEHVLYQFLFIQNTNINHGDY
jgi:hypothetical protein